MTPDEWAAEQLNEAIEAAQHGTGRAADPALSPEMAPLLAVAGRLCQAARPEPGVPRPTFVLGLEEKLRTDLRLEAGWGRPDGRSVHPLGLLSLAVLGLVLTGFLVQRAGPNDSLRPWQAPLRSLRLAVAFTPGGRTDVLLDDGWRRVQEVRQLAAEGRLDQATLGRLLTEIEAIYDQALQVSASEARAERQAVAEAEAAADVLAEVAATAPPPVAAVAAAGRAALQARIGRVGPIAGVPLPPPASPTPAAVAVRPTATIAATVPEPPTVVPSTATAVPATQPPAPTPLPMPATPTTVVTAAVPPRREPRTPTATPTQEPPRREPRTPTVPPSPPTPIVITPPVPASPTGDAWATATPPPMPSEPSPGAGPRTTPPAPRPQP